MVGAGPIGVLVIRVLRADGVARIGVVEPLAHRRAVAETSGAAALGPTGGDGAWDVVLDCAGEDDAVASAVALARPGGRIVLVGIPADDRTTVQASIARRKGLTLTWCRRMRPVDLDRAIERVASGELEVGSIVSHRLPLEAVDDAFRILVERRGHKVVVEPTAAAGAPA